MATSDGPPLSMRPFPVADKSPKNLADFIARVNALPGGFRAVSKESLEEEASRSPGADGDAETRDVDMSDGDDEDDEEGQEEVDDGDEGDDEMATNDPVAARAEVLKNIDVASNAALLTLDTISLLVSKQNPTQAGVTLSQQLRDMVGIGTLGADRLDDSNMTPSRIRDQEQVATGFTLMEIDRARDAAQKATSFLAREMAAEGRYWEGVVGVKQAGWSVCRLPQQRHALGVRFGFSEAAPEFKRNGLAHIQRGEDGSAELDIGRLGGAPERLVVTYLRNGTVVGRAAAPSSEPRRDGLPQQQSLEARVLEARNTIFAQELWHELTREARSLAAYGVRHDDEGRLVCDLDGRSSIVVELVTTAAEASSTDDDADDADQQQQKKPLPEDAKAQAVYTTLHILLTHAHRCNELLRTRPLPPYIPRSRGQQIYTLLRPIIARSLHARSVAACTRLVGNLVRSLRNAGLVHASFTLRTPPPAPAVNAESSSSTTANSSSNQQPSAVSLVRHLLQPTDFALRIRLFPGATMTVRGRTYLVPVTATYYHVFFDDADADADKAAPFRDVSPPFADGYPHLAALAEYLAAATARVLAAHHVAKLTGSDSDDDVAAQASSGSEEEKKKKKKWLLAGQGACIRNAMDPDAPQAQITVGVVGAGAADDEDGPTAMDLVVSRVSSTQTTVTSSTDLEKTAAAPAGRQSWTWRPDRDDSAGETLEAAVREVFKR